MCYALWMHGGSTANTLVPYYPYCMRSVDGGVLQYYYYYPYHSTTLLLHSESVVGTRDVCKYYRGRM
jgi:hypothetical protein